MGLFDKVKSKLSDNGQASFQSSQGNQQVPDFPLGTESIIRYRKQRGVNLGTTVLSRGDCLCTDCRVLRSIGAWFSQEAWITSDPFQNAVNPRQSDVSSSSLGLPPMPVELTGVTRYIARHRQRRKRKGSFRASLGYLDQPGRLEMDR
jgi:hypothetical protein